MAKIQEQSVVITFSKLVRDDETASGVISHDVVTALHGVAQELADAGVVVEIDQK